MKRALLLLLMGAWFLMSAAVGVLIVWIPPQRTELAPRTDLFEHVGEDGVLWVYCEYRSLNVFASTPGASGPGRDEIDVRFAGLGYAQSALAVGRSFHVTIPAWAWFSATFAAPAALLIWRWRRRKSAAARRGFLVGTDKTTTVAPARSLQGER